MRSTHIPQRAVGTLLMFGMAMSVFTGCGRSQPSEENLKTGGSRSAIFSTDALALRTVQSLMPRKSSSLGVFVSEYLSTASLIMAAQGGIDAIHIQSMIVQGQQTVSDPDFELLQALADALQVDVADLLNRSDIREQALDAYSEALTNVATRANDRFRELSSSLEQLEDTVRDLNKERSTADRDLKKAIKDKDFTAAGELQKIFSEKQSTHAEAELQLQEGQSMRDALDELLTLYGEKILAIQKNREALIIGIRVVDVPGIDDLDLIERVKSTRSRARGGDTFQGLFEGGPGLL